MDLTTAKAATKINLGRPDFSLLLDRVRALAPEFARIAADTEANKRVPSSTMDLLRRDEILKVVKPAAFGGFEYGPAEAAQIAFELGRACGSTGWCGSLAVYFHLMLSYFPLEAQRAVYATDKDLIAVAYNPSKNCERVDGGYRLSGAWP